MPRPRRCTLSLSEGASSSYSVGEASFVRQVEPEIVQSPESIQSHSLVEPSVVVQVVPPNVHSVESRESVRNGESMEDNWGMMTSEWEKYHRFSRDIPGIRPSDPTRYPKLIREIAFTIISSQASWSGRLKSICERFYTPGVEIDPNEQVSLLKALYRFTQLYDMPSLVLQTVLGALAKMENFANKDVEKVWLAEHQKTQNKYLDLMLKFMNTFDFESTQHKEFKRMQAFLGDYGVKLKLDTSFADYEKQLFRFWISNMKLYSIYSKSKDAMQEIAEVQMVLIIIINHSNSKKKLQSKIAALQHHDPRWEYLTKKFVDNLKSLQHENKIKDFISIQRHFGSLGLQIIGESYRSADEQKILEFWGRHMLMYFTIKSVKNQRSLILGVESLVLRNIDETNRMMKEYYHHMYSCGCGSNILRDFLKFCVKNAKDRLLRSYAGEAVKDFDNGSYLYGVIPSPGGCSMMR